MSTTVVLFPLTLKLCRVLHIASSYSAIFGSFRGMIALDWSKKSRMEGQSLWFKVLKILQRSCVKKIGNVVRYIAQIVTTFLLVSYTLIIYTQTGILNQSGHNCFVLYAFVEILQEAPEGWNLVLVDTPGFGEANIRHVTARTDILFSTSTAYLYIIDSGSMGDDVDAKKIKLLYQHDKG